MNYMLAYALSGIGTLLVIIWAILYLKYRNSFDNILVAIDSKKFMMPELFFIGFGFMDMFKVNLKTEGGRKKEKKIAEVYGEKYAEYYHYCIVGGQITYLLTIAPLGLFIGAITNDILYAFLALAATVAIIVSLDMDVSKSILICVLLVVVVVVLIKKGFSEYGARFEHPGVRIKSWT